MAVAQDDLGRAVRKRGIEGQGTTIRHFGIRCIGVAFYKIRVTHMAIGFLASMGFYSLGLHCTDCLQNFGHNFLLSVVEFFQQNSIFSEQKYI